MISFLFLKVVPFVNGAGLFPNRVGSGSGADFQTFSLPVSVRPIVACASARDWKQNQSMAIAQADCIGDVRVMALTGPLSEGSLIHHPQHSGNEGGRLG